MRTCDRTVYINEPSCKVTWQLQSYYLHLVSIFTESELISVSWDPHDILDWTKNIEV